MALVDHLFAVIPMLGLLIFVHELGHFLAAKAFGVRVLKFSLGFGAPVGIGRYRMRWERKGTEYVIAWFPLGGFVRMLGGYLPGDEESIEEAPDATPDEYLHGKPVWQKLIISFAGPAMNLFLPVLCFLAIFWVGTPRSAPVVGMVEEGSPAAIAGVLPGDRVLSIDGEAVQWWDNLAAAISAQVNGDRALRIQRGELELELVVSTRGRSSLDGFGDVREVGWIGIGHRRLPALVGVIDPQSPAALAGLQSADRVLSVAGQPVEDWVGFERAYLGQESAEVALELQRKGEEDQRKLTVPVAESLDRLGVIPATILIDDVNPDLPAGRAGLRSGDLILTVDGRPAGSFSSFQQTVLSGKGRPLDVSYARDDELTTVRLTPEKTTVPGPLGIEGMDETVFLIGITHRPSTLPGVAQVDRERNPLVAVPRAVVNTGDMIAVFMVGLGKLLTGEVGADKLSGPIGIAEVARKSLDLGWHFYIRTMMFISINLGILNLLPIPILDGGQIVLFSIEGIKRAPVSVRTREIVQSVGLTMLVMLMGLAFWNDLSRHWARFVEWLGVTGL